MQCPLCNVQLLMADRLGVGIDYCPKCRGVWLDRGDLDQIVEKSLRNAGPVRYEREGDDRNRDDDEHSGTGEEGDDGKDSWATYSVRRRARASGKRRLHK